jgi:beta-glucosidase
MRIPGFFLLTIATLLYLPPCLHAQMSLPFQDPSRPLDQRVRDLVSRMTLNEKIAQMQNHAPAIQRLGVPEYDWWSEALHGVARTGFATVFPQAIGMAATWDPGLIHQEADVIGTEARAKHHEAVRQNKGEFSPGLDFWSPNINIFRDPRWGRGQETYGEDPFLTSRLGVSFVKGLQGDDPRYFKVISTPKHYAVHSGPEPIRHMFDARTRTRDLYETYLPAFEACVTEGGAWSIMGAYNRFDGVPCCANRLLLGDILRKAWNFKGYVVSDCGAISDIHAGHKYAHDDAEASSLAVKAGCDLSCGGEYESLADAVTRGLITEKEIDVSVMRLMTARFRLGMFDPPSMVPYTRIPISENDSPEHSALALQVARESIVLLKNANGALPLNKQLKSIAVVGPTADDLDVLVGNYNGTPSHPVTILQGIRDKVGPGTKVTFARGCDLAEGLVRLDSIPAHCLMTKSGASGREGLTGEYFTNMELKGAPAFVRVDRNMNFQWGIDRPAPGFPAERYSVRWTGKLVPEVSGRYVLGATVDDGVRLFIDSLLLVEDWKDNGAHEVSRAVDLMAGKEYDIRLEYYQNGGDAVMALGWSAPFTDPGTEAMAIARDADQIIAVMGISPQLEGEEMGVKLDGFLGGDRTDIVLPAPQEKLLKALAGLGKPMVLVLTNGSALAVNRENGEIPAIIDAWYPGQQGGNAVADVLFGDYNPAGRLPVTFYKSIKDLPSFENYSMEGRTYRYFTGEPLYPFGYGLSYTRFDYSNMRVTRPTVRANDTIRVALSISNSGKFDGDEVVQVYVRHAAGRSGDPSKSLKGFLRTHVNRGEKRSVEIPVAAKDLRRYNEKKNRYEIVPGVYELQIGSSSSDIMGTVRVQVRP